MQLTYSAWFLRKYIILTSDLSCREVVDSVLLSVCILLLPLWTRTLRSSHLRWLPCHLSAIRSHRRNRVDVKIRPT